MIGKVLLVVGIICASLMGAIIMASGGDDEPK